MFLACKAAQNSSRIAGEGLLAAKPTRVPVVLISNWFSEILDGLKYFLWTDGTRSGKR